MVSQIISAMPVPVKLTAQANSSCSSLQALLNNVSVFTIRHCQNCLLAYKDRKTLNFLIKLSLQCNEMTGTNSLYTDTGQEALSELLVMLMMWECDDAMTGTYSLYTDT